MCTELSLLAVPAFWKEVRMPFRFVFFPPTHTLKHILRLASRQVADSARVTDSF